MRKLKQGMWVKNSEGKTGVLYHNSITNSLEFHLVDQDEGTTTLIIPIVGEPESSGYAQASHADIPEPRRPHHDVSKRLGYMR